MYSFIVIHCAFTCIKFIAVPIIIGLSVRDAFWFIAVFIQICITLDIQSKVPLKIERG